MDDDRFPDDVDREQQDSELYAEIAQANLLRMRGNYDAAKDACLSLLKRYPENVTTHTLLGDIHAEQNDLAQAVDWYEIALDLQPDAVGVQAKLDAARARLSDRETAETVEALGLAKPAVKPIHIGALVAAFAIVAAVAAFFIGRYLSTEDRDEGQKITQPIVIAGEDVKPEPDPELDVNPPEETVTGEPEVRPTLSSRDRAIMDQLNEDLPPTWRVIDVVEDPRYNSLTITVRTSAEDDEPLAALSVAAAAFAKFPGYMGITMRVVGGDSLRLVGDVVRADEPAIQEAIAPEFEGDRLAIFSSLWRAEPVVNPTPGSGSR